VLVAFAAWAPASAWAVNSQVIADCNTHGKLTGHYSNATLRNALATLPVDVKEYTNCADVITSQLLAQVSGKHPPGSGSGGGSGGSFLPTWVIVLLVVLILGGGGATIAARRRT
jgi:hypothetical protein